MTRKAPPNWMQKWFMYIKQVYFVVSKKEEHLVFRFSRQKMKTNCV